MRLPLAIVLDHEASVRQSTAEALRRAGFDVAVAASPRELLELVRARSVGVVVLGVAGSADASSDLVARTRRIRPTAVIALLDGDGDRTAPAAVRADVFDVLPRPPLPTRLAAFATRALAHHRLLEELASLRGGQRAENRRLSQEDVPAVTREIVEEVRRLNGLPTIEVSVEALDALARHDWKGDAEALRHAVETAVILAGDGAVRAEHLPAALLEGAGQLAARVRADRRFRDAKRSVVDAFERSYLSDLLMRHGGNVTAAAEQSGMLRSALQRLLRKHEIRSSSFRDRASSGIDAS